MLTRYARGIMLRPDDGLIEYDSAPCITNFPTVFKRSPTDRDASLLTGAAVIGLLLSACATAPPDAPSGAQVFATHCASCHGVRGEGDGPVAESIAVPVPNLRNLNARYGGEFPADAIASYIDGRNLPDAHGARQMPVWGLVFAATEQIVPGAAAPATRIESLVQYLRTLQNP